MQDALKGDSMSFSFRSAKHGWALGFLVQVFERGDQAAMDEAIAQLEDGNWAVREVAVIALVKVDALGPRQNTEMQGVMIAVLDLSLKKYVWGCLGGGESQ